MSVPTEWEQAAVRAWDRSTSDHLNGPALQAALAAVAPIIAKAERERAIAAAASALDAYGKWNGQIMSEWLMKFITAAIRAHD